MLNFSDNPFTDQNLQQFSFMDVWDRWREVKAVIWIAVNRQRNFFKCVKSPKYRSQSTDGSINVKLK